MHFIEVSEFTLETHHLNRFMSYFAFMKSFAISLMVCILRPLELFSEKNSFVLFYFVLFTSLFPQCSYGTFTFWKAASCPVTPASWSLLRVSGLVLCLQPQSMAGQLGHGCLSSHTSPLMTRVSRGHFLLTTSAKLQAPRTSCVLKICLPEGASPMYLWAFKVQAPPWKPFWGHWKPARRIYWSLHMGNADAGSLHTHLP